MVYVYVFGSNKLGKHYGGAAEMAAKLFGAEFGVSEGISGQSYAIPTLNEDFEKIDLDEIMNSIVELYDVAINVYPEKVFLVTKIGCGIAGYSEEEIRNCFFVAGCIKGGKPQNVVLPIEFE